MLYIILVSEEINFYFQGYLVRKQKKGGNVNKNEYVREIKQ